MSLKCDMRIVSISTTSSMVLVCFEPSLDAETVRQRLEKAVLDEAHLVARGEVPKPLSAIRPSLTSYAAQRAWHAMTAPATLRALAVDQEHGLSPAAVQEHRREYGANAVPPPAVRSPWEQLLAQVLNMPNALLGTSAVLSVLTGSRGDAVLITGVVAANAGIGYATERHSERIIAGLGYESPMQVPVIRDGRQQQISPSDLVVGDIVQLLAGPVAADIRVLATSGLSVDESTLTGESIPVPKQALALPEDLPLADRTNMLYKGTTIVGGTGRGIVVSVGFGTEVGRIETLVGSVRPKATPLQKRLDTLGTQMVWLASAICGGVLLTGLVRGVAFIQMLKTSISLAVAALPEGLPTVGTTTLALGVSQLKERNVLVRRLAAVENLGAIDRLCFDKTGTLTLNRMTVAAVADGHGRFQLRHGQIFHEGDGLAPPPVVNELHKLALVSLLCNDAAYTGEPGQGGVLKGSATEMALLRLAETIGLEPRPVRAAYPRRSSRYRTDQSSYMATLHDTPEGGLLLAVKGQPQEVLKHCRWRYAGDRIVPLQPTDAEKILATNAAFAGEALRVLGFAQKHASTESEANAAAGLVWLGLVGLKDPTREGVREMIEAFTRAGIGMAMITGDQELTAQAIGRELGIDPALKLSETDAETTALRPAGGSLPTMRVYSRVSPVGKLKILQELQEQGHVVAMAGDGVNDSPALRAADVGIAMGAGAGVAREAAEVVLADDNLETLYDAVRQGRSIRENLGKSLHFLLATNLSEILVTFGGVALAEGEVLSPRHLLWINLLTDVFPALALAMEQPESGIMQRPPRAQTSPFFEQPEWLSIAAEGTFIAAGALASFLIGRGRHGSGTQASTMAFLSLTVAQLLHTNSARSQRVTLFGSRRLPRNPYVGSAIFGGLMLQALSISFPPLALLLGNARLGALDLLTATAAGAAPFLVTEAAKAAISKEDVEVYVN